MLHTGRRGKRAVRDTCSGNTINEKNPLISQRAIFSVAERKRFELLVRF